MSIGFSVTVINMNAYVLPNVSLIHALSLG